MRRTISLTLTEKLLRFLISIYSSPVSIPPLPGVESNCPPLLSLQSLCGSVTISSMRSLIELIRLPVHTPLMHVSLNVAGFPSSQALLLFVFVHPLIESQASSVHILPSSQKSGEPDVHIPSLQTSIKVQAFPSSQGLLLFVNVHPLTESHVSSVHTLPSLQKLGAPDVHTPPLQTSNRVQIFPSSQAAILFVFVHPLRVSHESSVHTFPSLQELGAPDVHTPSLQMSNKVQTFPSSQRLLLFVYLHPVRRSHVSSVHTLPSSQLLGHSEEHSAHGLVAVHPITYLA